MQFRATITNNSGYNPITQDIYKHNIPKQVADLMPDWNAAAEHIPHHRFGKHYRFSRSDIAEILASTAHQADASPSEGSTPAASPSNSFMVYLPRRPTHPQHMVGRGWRPRGCASMGVGPETEGDCPDV